MYVIANRKTAKRYMPNVNDSNDIKLCFSADRMREKRVLVEESVRKCRDRKHDFRRSGRSGKKASKKG